MFTKLRFRMRNSIGTPVTVCLYNNDGLVDYEIALPELGAKETKRQSLGRSGSSKFLNRLEKSAFVSLISQFVESGGKENEGDFWELEIELEDGARIHLSGPELEESVLYPFIQDFSELLDRQFSITQFVSPNRVDKLEILFLYNEIDTDLLETLPEVSPTDHTETVVLDRSKSMFGYAKRFPAGCFHSSYECKCEQQIRQILDQTTAAIEDPRVFEDVIEPFTESPVVLFCYTFHDGSKARVQRSLSRSGLREQLYVEMIEVLFETSLHLMYKGGLFDKRFLLSKKERESEPFIISYREDSDDAMVEERVMA